MNKNLCTRKKLKTKYQALVLLCHHTQNKITKHSNCEKNRKENPPLSWLDVSCCVVIRKQSSVDRVVKILFVEVRLCSSGRWVKECKQCWCCCVGVFKQREPCWLIWYCEVIYSEAEGILCCKADSVGVEKRAVLMSGWCLIYLQRIWVSCNIKAEGHSGQWRW